MAKSSSPQVPVGRSGYGTFAVGIAILATVGVGYVTRRKKEVSETNNVVWKPRRTTATAKVAGFGSDLRKLTPELTRGANYINTEPNRTMTAAWIRVAIPGGLHNWPQPTFKLAAASGEIFPFETCWTKDSAFLLIPKGYGGRPKDLQVTVLQGDRLVTKAAVPMLPESDRAATPEVSPLWPDLNIWTCRTNGDAKGPVMIAFQFKKAPKNMVTARCLGSSANEFEPCNHFSFVIHATNAKVDPPVVSMFSVFYPKQTKCIYLKLSEVKSTFHTENASPGDQTIQLTGTSYERVRTEIVAVPLPAGPLPVLTKYTRAFQVGGFGRGAHAGGLVSVRPMYRNLPAFHTNFK